MSQMCITVGLFGASTAWSPDTKLGSTWPGARTVGSAWKDGRYGWGKVERKETSNWGRGLR